VHLESEITSSGARLDDHVTHAALESRAEETHLLEAELARLRLDVREASDSRAVVELQLRQAKEEAARAAAQAARARLAEEAAQKEAKAAAALLGDERRKSSRCSVEAESVRQSVLKDSNDKLEQVLRSAQAEQRALQLDCEEMLLEAKRGLRGKEAALQRERAEVHRLKGRNAELQGHNAELQRFAEEQQATAEATEHKLMQAAAAAKHFQSLAQSRHSDPRSASASLPPTSGERTREAASRWEVSHLEAGPWLEGLDEQATRKTRGRVADGHVFYTSRQSSRVNANAQGAKAAVGAVHKEAWAHMNVPFESNHT